MGGKWKENEYLKLLNVTFCFQRFSIVEIK